MSVFVPVSSETCGIYHPSEACDLEDEGSVERRKAEEVEEERDGGAKVLRRLMGPLENMVPV